jgi:AcrR family transcriptional regulator
MQMVAAEAELGMQGLYEHFPSKQALYDAVVLHRAQAFVARLGGALEGLDDPLDQLRVVARVRVEVFFEAPAFLPVFLSELIRFDLGVESRTDPAVHAVFREVRDRVDGIITRAMEREQLRPADPYFLLHVALEHARLYEASFRNHERYQFSPMRKHLGWYAHDVPSAKSLRRELTQTNSVEDVAEVLERYFAYRRQWERYTKPPPPLPSTTPC